MMLNNIFPLMNVVFTMERDHINRTYETLEGILLFPTFVVITFG